MAAILLVVAIGSMLSSCTGLRYSTEDRPLYTGFELDWTDEPSHDRKAIVVELEEVVKPAANNSILGTRPTVALFNGIKEPKKGKGIFHWLKNDLGTEGIYLDDLPLADINAALMNRLNNRGHFSASSTFEVMRKGRKASVRFTISPGPVHLIGSVDMGDPSGGELDSALAAERTDCLIRTDEPYDLQKLTKERERISVDLRDLGWYRLRADDLIWTTDTTKGGLHMDLHLRIKPTTSSIKRLRYSIGTVTMHGDQDDVLPPKDTVVVDSIRYVNYLDMYRPKAVLRGATVRPGDRYSLERTTAMQRFLNSYGVFRNVLVGYADDTARTSILNANITLLPMKQRSLFGEMNMVSKSNNFAGPGLRFGLVDRNVFRGAEQLTIDLNGNYETQISGEGKGTNAYQLGIKAGLAIPRRVLFGEPHGLRNSAPITNITAGYGLYRRIGLYGMRTSSAGLDYSWNRDRRVWHDLQLIEVSFNDLYYTSDEFDEFLQENPTIQRSFEDQFIIGSGYTYTRSTRRSEGQRSWWVYSLGADESGNIVAGLMSLTEGPGSEDAPYELAGQVFSQYVRLRPELRWFHLLGGSGGQLVTRLLTHVGISYGNTTVMPYVKQFYAGGTNSLRGFRARSVGPGSYVSPQSDNLLVDQVGDLKLELNLEYRFTFTGMFKGALFVDAGNIWLLREDPSRPGGEFRSESFVGEVAMNTGVGFRVDAQVIVVRLDLATPIRRPDLPVGDRWAWNHFDRQWNRNMILNIAIGYPF